MRTHRLHLILPLCLAVAAILGCGGSPRRIYMPEAPYAGQQPIAGNGAVAGNVLAVRPGFSPNPMRSSGRFGGSTTGAALTSRAAGCNIGRYPQQPTHVIQVDPGMTNVAVKVEASLDTTLAIQTPNGGWVCNDDTSPSDRNPQISFPAPAAGHYQVFVGAYRQQDTGPHNLVVNGMSGAPTTPGPIMQPGTQPGVTPNGTGNAQVIAVSNETVRQGVESSGVAGGTTPGETLSRGNRQCGYGFYGQPNQVLDVAPGTANLYLLVGSTADTSLAVVAPDGNVSCGRDLRLGHPNPAVGIEAPSGRYLVYVGVEQPAQAGTPYTLTVMTPGANGYESVPDPMHFVDRSQSSVNVRGTGLGRDVRLRTGLIPDPHLETGALELIPAPLSSAGPSCSGFSTSSPSHIVYLEEDFHYLRFISRLETGATASLLVTGPNGVLLCGSDSGNSSAFVEGEFPAGTYRVWIGAGERERSSYTFGITELNLTSGADLPAP